MRADLSENLPRIINLLEACSSLSSSLHQRKIMDIQEFLTYFINTFVLSSILFFLLDFSFFLVELWPKLSPSPQPSFYQQVKDAFWERDSALGISTT